ncbi:MAG TPA: DUF1501 domain-containing protein [Bryobacteraceae bacterium]|jgi:hypothetical protein|nr:DUF1501 domain-containing protein [Bryobacteraceae bacterium]
MSLHRSKPQLSRREMLCRCANGFGGLALASLLAEAQGAPAPHFPAKAKSVIFLFMDGGPSQMDTFDPKPRLRADHGKTLPFKPPTTVFNISDKILGSPFDFARHGQSGAHVSDLFPHVAKMVDELTIIRSMVSDHSEHTAANYFMHSGSGFQGRPSMGGWLVYGLGSECKNLPGFLVLESGLIPPGGMDLFGSGFLPATYQGTIFRKGNHPVADLQPREASPELQQAKLRVLSRLSQGVKERFYNSSEVEATIQNYELAFRMQSEVPQLVDLSGESEATRRLYGLDERDSEEFGRQCLLARRLVERGVRFVELLPPFRKGVDRWDQHSSLEDGHRTNARAVDKPIAGLLRDLKSRGLLDETIVLWGGEFGRTPCAQMGREGFTKSVGRDHNPFGFTMWIAGGGFRPGIAYGSTDEFGYYATENKVHVHDLHATILHQLGLDHKRLTYRFGGRDMRLTDVHGEVIKGLLA